MFFGLSKISFSKDGALNSHRRELSSLASKMNQKFHICAKPLWRSGQSPAIYIALLGAREGSLHQEIDKILDYCEKAGFGRVESEFSIVDHFDTIQYGDF